MPLNLKHMNKAIIILIYLSALILGISCRNQSIRIKPVLQKAEQVLEQNPDSTLALLYEITDSKKLNKRIYYQYHLLEIQAKYKSYKDIATDTLIFTIRDFYKKRNELEKTALATFYCGRVYEVQKNYEKAMQEYLLAESKLEKNKDFNLRGLCQSAIGQIYYEQFLKQKAIVYYKQAKKYFHEAKNYKNEIIVTNQIGNCFLMDEKIDSAFFYYHQANKQADKYEYKNQQAKIRVSLGVAHRKIEDWEQSEIYFKEALPFSTDSLHQARIFSNLAKLYEFQGKSDLTKTYLSKALLNLPSDGYNSLVANIYKTWSNIEESENNYYEALEKYKLYNKYLAQILKDNRNAAILEIEEKYDFQLIENKNKQLLIEEQRIIMASLVLILICLLTVLAFFIRSIKREKELREAEHKISQMQKMVHKFDENENSYRNVLISHLGIIKKAALLEKYLKEDEKKKGQRLLRKFNQVVYGQGNLNWNLLFETLNNVSNGSLKKLKNNLSQLDESEFRICCLIYTDFNNTEIALVLNYSLGTVEVKKSTIRKKLGIESRGNIRDFIEIW